MSAPRILIQVVVVGAQIFGKALLAAGKQAVQNAKHRPGMAEEAAGVRTGDAITQTHRMTVDEAHLILNVKKGEPMPNILKNYEHLFKVNSPPEAPATPTTGASAAGGRRGAASATRYHSHYIQSKIVRARERIEAEFKIQQEAEDATRLGGDAATKVDATATATPPPPPAAESRPPPPP